MARYQPQNPWLWVNDPTQEQCEERQPLSERIRRTERSLAIVREDYASVLELYATLHGEDRSGDSANRRGLQISIVRCEMRIEQLRTTLEGLRAQLRNVS